MIFHRTNKDAAMQELFEEANRGADGKWVISHGIKNRTVGSEWDYNGMIIYIYNTHTYIYIIIYIYIVIYIYIYTPYGSKYLLRKCLGYDFWALSTFSDSVWIHGYIYIYNGNCKYCH